MGSFRQKSSPEKSSPPERVIEVPSPSCMLGAEQASNAPQLYCHTKARSELNEVRPPTAPSPPTALIHDHSPVPHCVAILFCCPSCCGAGVHWQAD